MGENILTDDDALLMTDVMRAYNSESLPPDDHYDNRPANPESIIDYIDRPIWQTRGACYGLRLGDIFFPPGTFERKDERLEREEKAKRICGTCTVRQECLDFALINREKGGVWGGLNEAERNRYKS